MKLESGWVPVALSSSIEPATSTGAVVEGSEIVVWRDSSGQAHVWEDRCPHRGMRLSFGFVRGDHIACLYHGWQYDTAGQCRHIPAHPDLDVPATIKVPIYSAAEKNGIIWTTSAPDAQMPALPEALDITSLRSLHVDSPLAEVLAALGKHHFKNVGGHSGTLMVENMQMLVALQVVAVRRTVLHMVALAAADAPTLKSLSRWAEDLRFGLESPDLATAEVA